MTQVRDFWSRRKAAVQAEAEAEVVAAEEQAIAAQHAELEKKAMLSYWPSLICRTRTHCSPEMMYRVSWPKLYPTGCAAVPCGACGD